MPAPRSLALAALALLAQASPLGGCAGDEKSPLPYFGLPASAGGSGGASGAGGQAGASGAPAQPGAVVINEIDPSGDPADWIELKNRSSTAIDLAGWSLAQGYDGSTPPADADRLLLPAGTVLDPGAYLVVFTKPPDGPGPGDFGIGKDAPERMSLFDPAGQLVDDTTTDGSANNPIAKGTTWARLPDGDGAFARAPESKGAGNGM